MKNVITLTKSLTLAVLLLVFAGASAAGAATGNDTIKCKKHCCRNKETEKEVQLAMKGFNEAMKELTIQIQNLETGRVKADVIQTLSQLPVRMVKTTNGFMLSYNIDADETQVNGGQKIDFNNLNKEMDKVQEGMTQMDPSLKRDDARSRRAAEELLKTGIKS
jgi:hypothetical protein